MTDRRALIVGAGAAAGAASLCRPRVALANRLPILGFIGFSSAEGDRPFLEAVRRGLREAGLMDGVNIRVESRHANGDVEKAGQLIAELIGLGTDVFLAPGPAAARAVRGKTATPVVAVQLPPAQSDGDLYQSLARPGGSVTGFSSFGEGLSAKRIELLKEMLPALRVVGIVHNGTDLNFRDWGVTTEADARNQALVTVRTPVTSMSASELDELFAKLASAGAGALIVIRDFMTSALAEPIARRALSARMAVVAEHRDFAEAGALASYGPDILDLFRRSGLYVARILSGERASDLPIQLPTKFELVVNQRTARQLGIAVPASILIRADEVIE